MARFSPGKHAFRLDVHAHFQARTRIGKWWNGIPMHNEFWRIYFNFQSGVTLTHGDLRVPLPPKRLVLIPPHFDGTGWVKGEVEHAFIHFDVSGLPPGLISQLFPQPIEVPFNPSLRALNSAWLKSLGRGKSPHSLADYLRVESLAAQTFAIAWERSGAEQTAAWIAWREGAPRFASLDAWLAENLDQNLTVTRLAARWGCSADHFRRLFQRIFGVNPASYVTRLRIKEGARQLLFGSASIDEIAEKTGYGDRHHFSRIFRKITGQSPAAYRNRHAALHSLARGATN